jgi:uncharacterized damage-inducible protein DinB
VGPHWIEAFRYHRWANDHLLEVCSSLPAEQLELTTPGTYGTISATWHHLAGAQERYVARLSSREPQFSERDPFPGIQGIAGHLGRTTEALIDLAATVPPEPAITAKFRDGQYRLYPGVVLLQALHHGNDHRTHICTILGANSIEYGDMDLWAYGEATGNLEKVSG